LGGNVFRLLFGEVVSYLNKRQDHSFEVERLKLQGDLDAAQHVRNLEAIKQQAELGVKVIEAQAVAAVGQIEAEGWLEAVKATGRAIGVAWVDAWNACIRPGVATWAVLMLTVDAFKLVTLTEFTTSVCSAALGIYLADRSLFKRGKQ
jgi:hypothetical protein